MSFWSEKNRVFLVTMLLLAALAVALTGCGGGGGGGGAAPAPTPAAQVIDASNIIGAEGLFDGAAVRNGTQNVTGTLPNPGGDTATTFEGTAFMVINGDRIPVNMTAADALARGAEKVIYKEGKEYPYGGPSAEADLLAAQAKADATTWVFSATFSVNAGPNTVSFEVYDLSDTLWAATSQWTIIGAIEPTDLVVTLWWDTNLTDIDLHVNDGTDHCYYSHTTAGDASRGIMVLDYDDVNGYGPEHITVDSVVGTQNYEIRVYYYADHNESEQTTPTTCYVTAQVAGQTVLQGSSSLSSESTSSGWTTGDHVWEVGTVEATGAVSYTITLGDPVLTSYPTVTVPVTVLDPSNNNEGVAGLTASNFYLINAGTAMSPVTVSADRAAGEYTLTYTDITAGKRDVYVYVYAPDADGQGFAGGLSDTKTYGTNYAVLTALNEYPPSTQAVDQWYDAAGPVPHIKTTIRSTHKVPDGAGDFTATFTDSTGGTNRPTVTVTGSSMTAPGTANGLGQYDIAFPAPANYLDYDGVSLKFKKASWLSNSVNDIDDVEAALKAKATLTSNSMWEAGNIFRFTDAGATEAAVLGKIQEVAGLMQKYDMLYFHYSGHGADGATDANQYLCTYEDANWVSVDDLKAKLALVPDPTGNITNVIVALDACFAGNFIDKGLGDEALELPEDVTEKRRDFLPQAEEALDYGLAFQDIAKGITGTNYFIMTAVDGDHSAWDVGELQNGVFTYYLVEGIDVTGKAITSAAANANHDTWVTGEEAYNYLQPKAKTYVETNITPTNAGAAEEAQFYPDLTTNSRFIYNW